MSQITCGFIGLGLIGGSIARALREKLKENVTIIAYDINHAALSLAIEEKVADMITSRIDENFSSCDYLFLCAPVTGNDANLVEVKKYLSPACTLTDVGSVKTDIHREIEALGLQSQFIGGHPMAGSERTGYSNSKSRLLENAYFILTPSKECAVEKVSTQENYQISDLKNRKIQYKQCYQRTEQRIRKHYRQNRYGKHH